MISKEILWLWVLLSSTSNSALLSFTVAATPLFLATWLAVALGIIRCSLSLHFFSSLSIIILDSLSLLLYYSQFNTLSSHFISQQSIFAFHFVSKGLFGYRLLLKTKNWRHYSKIIFKCMNSIVGPSFKVIFDEFRTCGSHGQYTGPTKKKQPH